MSTFCIQFFFFSFSVFPLVRFAELIGFASKHTNTAEMILVWLATLGISRHQNQLQFSNAIRIWYTYTNEFFALPRFWVKRLCSRCRDWCRAHTFRVAVWICLQFKDNIFVHNLFRLANFSLHDNCLSNFVECRRKSFKKILYFMLLFWFFSDSFLCPWFVFIGLSFKSNRPVPC